LHTPLTPSGGPDLVVYVGALKPGRRYRGSGSSTAVLRYLGGTDSTCRFNRPLTCRLTRSAAVPRTC